MSKSIEEPLVIFISLVGIGLVFALYGKKRIEAELNRIFQKRGKEEVAAAVGDDFASECPDFVEDGVGYWYYYQSETELGFIPPEDMMQAGDVEEKELADYPSDEEQNLTVEFYNDVGAAELSEEEIVEIVRQGLEIPDDEEIEVKYEQNESLEDAADALGPDGDRVVFAVTPDGNVVSSFFTEENMYMAREVAGLEGKSLDDVLMETIAARYDMVKEDDSDDL